MPRDNVFTKLIHDSGSFRILNMKQLTATIPLTILLATIHISVALGELKVKHVKKGRLTPNGDVVMNEFQTLPIEQVLKEHRVKEVQTGRFTSSIASVVVRQDDPNGPKYQEGLGYRFLVYTAVYPGLCTMDDGKLVLTFSTGRDFDRRRILARRPRRTKETHCFLGR